MENLRILQVSLHIIWFDLRKDDGSSKNVSENGIMPLYAMIQILIIPCVRLKRIKDICCGKLITHGEFLLSDGKTVAEEMKYAYLGYRDNKEVMEQRDNAIIVNKDNVFWICDLGEEMTGHITIDVEASEGAVIDIAYGEHLADMRVRSAVGKKFRLSYCLP